MEVVALRPGAARSGRGGHGSSGRGGESCGGCSISEGPKGLKWLLDLCLRALEAGGMAAKDGKVVFETSALESLEQNPARPKLWTWPVTPSPCGMMGGSFRSLTRKLA